MTLGTDPCNLAARDQIEVVERGYPDTGCPRLPTELDLRAVAVRDPKRGNLTSKDRRCRPQRPLRTRRRGAVLSLIFCGTDGGTVGSSSPRIELDRRYHQRGSIRRPAPAVFTVSAVTRGARHAAALVSAWNSGTATGTRFARRIAISAHR